MKRRWVIALGAILIGLVLLIRNNRYQILNPVRSLNKRILNPILAKLVGLPNSPIAIVHHVGRRSGKPYQTPVIVEPLDGSFVFTLTYGPWVDWYKNILAAGECGLIWHGREFTLANPKNLDAQAALSAFPAPLRPILSALNIQDFFKMDILSS
jgi:deazaflavin-dependent oxidoreductase (nitroreductase family)